MSKNTQQKEIMSAQNDDVMEDDFLLKDITRKAIPKRKRSWTSKAVEISASSPEVKRERRSKKNQEEELSILKVKEAEGALKKFRTTSRSHSLVMLINNLEDHQKEAIKEIGFGGLLDLKLTCTPSAMITKLIDAFDVTTSTMIISKDKSFRITKDDVRDVFGLPSGPSCVEYLMMGNLSAKSEIKDKWRAMFYASKGIPITKLLQTLKEHKKSDDLFKQMFVLYAMSQFLSPTSNSEADMRLLKAVDVVSEIKNIDWCSHVYSELVAAIKQFKASPPTYLRGCFLFLMVSWFHKFDYREDSLSTELPLIKHWDDVKLTDMITIEVAPGKFGSAPLRKYDEPNLEVHQTTPEKKDLPPVKRYLQIELPNDILTDEEIDAQATNEVHALCLKNNRDTLLYYTRYSERVDLMKSLLRKEHCIAENAEATTSTSDLHLSPTQPILKNPYFIQYLDFLEEKAKLYKRNAQSLPTFEDYCQKNGISVGDSEVGKSTPEEPRASAKEVTKNSVVDETIMTLVDVDNDGEDDTLVDVDVDRDSLVDVDSDGEDDTLVDVDRDTLVDVDRDTLVDVDSDGHEEQTVVGDQGCTFPQLSIPEIETIVSSAGVIENAMKELQEAERMKGVDDSLKLPDEVMLDATAERCLSSIINIDIPQVVGTSYLLHCEEYEATMSLVPSNLGCSLNCGEVDPTVCVISKTLFEKKERYEKMLSLRKRVVDYCLLNDSTLPEMLVYFSSTL